MELKVGDAVEITRADPKHDCVYVGQRGRIIEMFAKEAAVHLKCGHLWNIALSSLQLFDATAVPVVEVPEEEEDRRYEDFEA